MKTRMGKFASTGVIVGKTKRDRRSQIAENKSSNTVTMGKEVPRQTDGKVGDITVRDVTGIGLRTYIKTNSGWYDINAMTSTYETNWIDINFTPNVTTSTHFSWTTNYNASEQCQYFKDSNGIVHLRGAILSLKISSRTPTPIDADGSGSAAWEASLNHTGILQTSSDGPGEGVVCDIETNGSGNPTFTLKNIGRNHIATNNITFTDPGNTSNTAVIQLVAHSGTDAINHVITTFPPGYRPYDYVYVPVATGTGGDTGALSIKSDGELKDAPTSLNATLTFLDGASFVAKQVTDSVAQGGTRSTRSASTGRGMTT